jgi:hypothetical protein
MTKNVEIKNYKNKEVSWGRGLRDGLLGLKNLDENTAYFEGYKKVPIQRKALGPVYVEVPKTVIEMLSFEENTEKKLGVNKQYGRR